MKTNEKRKAKRGNNGGKKEEIGKNEWEKWGEKKELRIKQQEIEVRENRIKGEQEKWGMQGSLGEIEEGNWKEQ